jgi:uncharacterized membrane protein YesL
MRKIILSAVATILSYLVFKFLYAFGALGHIDTDGKAPMAYAIIVGIISLLLWIWTISRIIKNPWQSKK